MQQELVYGVSLEQFAGACAGLDAGRSTSEVLASEAIDAARWRKANTAWERRIASDKAAKEEYDRLLAAAAPRYPPRSGDAAAAAMQQAAPAEPRPSMRPPREPLREGEVREPDDIGYDRVGTSSAIAAPVSLMPEDGSKPKKGKSKLPAKIDPKDRTDPIMSMLEVASLSMALEMLPDRTADICVKLGVEQDEAMRDLELWTAQLEEDAVGRREFQTLRTRMRDYWARFHAENAPAEPPPSSTSPAISSEETLFEDPNAMHAPRVFSDDKRVLSLLEYASLMASLEVTPHRADELHAKFGLSDGATRARELDAWKAYLEANPEERVEANRLRNRMRTDYAAAADHAPARSAPSVPKVAAPPQSSRDEARFTTRGPQRATLSLVDYAVLCADLARDPVHAEELFCNAGLAHSADRRAVDEAWRGRFASSPHEYREWQWLRDARTRDASLPRSSNFAIEGGPPPARPPELTLLEYSLLCVRLEHEPHRAEAIFAKAGLADPYLRRQVDETFRARLAHNPTEAAEVRAQMEHLRQMIARG